MDITPKLIEQTRRWLTRLIWDFHHDLTMSSKGDEAFEKWHEDKAKELLEYLTLSEVDRMESMRALKVGSTNKKRIGIV